MQNEIQIQPLKIDYTNLPEGIDKEELEQAAADGQQRNRLFQLITRAGDAMQPAKSALEKVIFGEQEEPKITTGEDGKTNVTVNNNRAGGLLGFANDVAKGFSENVSTPYSPNNMLPSKKGFARRFGEGLGTATRLLDNSAVRGAIAYGLSKSLGDNNALEQGLTAASMNMAAKNNDKLYRNDLEKMGFDTRGINGYITEDMYKNVISSQRAKNNRQNVGELAMLSPVIKKFVDANPALANVDIPASVANSLLRGDYTEAQIKAIMSNIALNNVKAGYYGSLTDVNNAALGEIGNGGGGVVVHTQPPQVVHNTNAF